MEVHEFSGSRCRWTIDNFSKLGNKRLYSDTFPAGGYKWRIIIFPKGVNVDYLSIYLEVPDVATLPKGWSRDAEFSLSLVNQIDSNNTIKKDTRYVFNASGSTCGSRSFILLRELNSSARGFILNDTCIIEAEVRLKRSKEDEARLNTVIKSVEAPEEQFKNSKPPDSQDEIPDGHGSKNPLISVNVPLPLEQSIPSAKIKERSEQEPVLEKTRVSTRAENDPFRNNEHPVTRSTVLEIEEVSTLKVEGTQEETKMVMTGQSVPPVNQSSAEPPGEPTAVEAGKRSSFTEFDKLFTDIQNLLGGESSKAQNFSSFLPPPCSGEEIADAKKFLKQCLNMSLSRVIELDKTLALKNSLSIMLTAGSFPSNMVDRTTKFLADIDQSCETYESAKQDISEAQKNEKAVGELMTALNQLLSEFIPLRNQAETVDREMAKLEKQMGERMAKKAQISKRLEDLAGRATTSKQALVSAEEKTRLSAVKKEQAEKKIGDMERSWESLKVVCFPSL